MSDASPAAAPAAPQTLTEHILAKLADAPAPLNLAGVKKGLPKPKGMKPKEFDAEVASILADGEKAGRVFAYPSAAKGAVRYWARDEKHAVREAGLAAADNPRTLAELVKAVKELSKADAAFLDGVLRDLIAEDRLFEHPPAGKGKAAKPRFGVTKPAPPPPPPHPLELKKNKAAFDKLVVAAQKLVEMAGVSAGDLLDRLRDMLAGPSVQPAAHEGAIPPPAPPADYATADAELATRILEAVAAAGPGAVLSLPDLRRLAGPHRNGAFDAAVLDLARAGRVSVFRHNQPGSLDDAEKAALVTDGHGNYFTGVAGRA